ncbi:hypothetical protein AVEN_103574-1, partial [Araneus ventricosus]
MSSSYLLPDTPFRCVKSTKSASFGILKRTILFSSSLGILGCQA